MQWVPTHASFSKVEPFPDQVDDSPKEFGEIRVTAYQTVDEEEDTFSKSTASFNRRWRAAVATFLRRSFTNDPNKASFLSYQP